MPFFIKKNLNWDFYKRLERGVYVSLTFDNTLTQFSLNNGLNSEMSVARSIDNSSYAT